MRGEKHLYVFLIANGLIKVGNLVFFKELKLNYSGNMHTQEDILKNTQTFQTIQ